MKTLLVSLFMLGILATCFYVFVQPNNDEIIDDHQNDYTSNSNAKAAATIIGQSVNGHDIQAFSFGSGDNNILLVGGIHGGYESNTVLLAKEFIKYFEINPNSIPENITITIIPVLNPDGLHASNATSSNSGDIDNSIGRFNGNKVDLNRNFDCKWQKESTWRNRKVSAGTAPFSEPEAKALRDVVLTMKPEVVIFWHSQSNAIYASECKNGILPQTIELLQIYSEASQYPSFLSFDAYPITGDAEGWLASIGIPALSVELATHESIEWEKNLKGINALLEYYSDPRE